MSLVPKTLIGAIQFYENHITPWTTNAVAIGTTSTVMTDVSSKTTAARAAFTAQQAALDVAKAATLTLKNAVDALLPAGSNVIKQIRAKAAATGDSVYVLAQIPAPATPSPVGNPGTPEKFKVKLNQDGTISLGWKCENPAGAAGTIYQIWRRVGADGVLDYLGGTGEKNFTDITLPAGSASVMYQIQGVRSTAVGPWGQFNVNFGVGSGGTTTASVEEVAAVRKAA